MKAQKIRLALYALSAGTLLCAFLLTFTISDYYIFNRFDEFNAVFIISQWIKKGALLLIPLAVFYDRRNCADAVKYVLPIFVILSCMLFGNFFEIAKPADTPAQEIYNSVNMFMPRGLIIALFFAQNAFMLGICALFFVRDGAKAASAKCAACWPAAAAACVPLNIFENFFNIDEIPADSFLRFANFTVWHLGAVIVLFAFAVCSYFYIRRKNERDRTACLAAMAVALLIQYHSKDSMVMGDGYNVYHTVLACIPLFICNIGVYIAAFSVLTRKKFLYSASFFIHAAGAVSVFIYFGKDDMSNYGIFCSYSILYFVFTHAVLFALCILPTALGQYKFALRDCAAPLIYYLFVVIAAAVCSAVVTSASMTWHTADGYYLQPDELIYPNYAFTQINPLPFEVPPVWTVKIWNYDMNVLYTLGLYAAYVGIFFMFYALYTLWLKVCSAAKRRHICAVEPLIQTRSEADGEHKNAAP